MVFKALRVRFAGDVPRRVDPTELASETEERFASTSSWIASNTRRLRAARGYTQLDLAERAGVSLQYVNQVESVTGRPNMTLRALSAFAAALACEPFELLTPTHPPTRRAVGRPPAAAALPAVGERDALGYAERPRESPPIGVTHPTQPTTPPRAKRGKS